MPAGAGEPAGNARLLRFPTISQDYIVFVYAGDLYRVPVDGGTAVRLTSHAGYESFPKFSPDGQSIAFTGQYDGNTEVFLIPVTGGSPERLTYTAKVGRDNVGERMGPNNIVMTWTKDGKNIIYRGKWETFSGLKANLYSVSAGGGPSVKLPLSEGGFCSFSPDGKLFAFNRMFREFRTWKYYRGGQADDIWITNLKSNRLDNITENPAQDIFPMWIGDEIYFASDRDRTMNLFVYDTRTKKTQKVTHFTEYDVKFPSCSDSKIVFENGGFLYVLDVRSKACRQVPVNLHDEGSYARTALVDASKRMTAYDLSPQGDHALITARGEVFTVPAGDGLTLNLTRSSGANDRQAAWSPDGKHIAYISDRSGESEIYISDPQGNHLQQLTFNDDTYILSLRWSKDSKFVYYTDRKGRLQRVSPQTGDIEQIAQSDRGMMRDFNLAPDGRWIAYSQPGDNEMSIIWVQDLVSGEKIQITDAWYDSYQPLFSEDGKYLFFTSFRSFRPQYASNEWNAVYGISSQVFAVILQADGLSPMALTDGVETASATKAPTDRGAKEETDRAKKTNKKTGEEAKKPAVEPVRIDKEGIMQRIVCLPDLGKNVRLVSAPKGKLYYRGSEMSCYDLKDRKITNMGRARVLALSDNGKKALVREGGKLGVSAFSGRLAIEKEVSTDAMKVPVNYSQEWKQIFDESWRIFRDFFYVENMHGVDWQAMHDKYAVLLPYVKHRHDLTYIIGEMIGELNIGHAYITSGDSPQFEQVATGLLGARFEKDAPSGFFKVTRILEGANWEPSLRSPLTEPGAEVKVGEYIVAVDNESCAPVPDIYRCLVGKADRVVALWVNDKPVAEGARRVLVKPVSDESELCYYNWVRENIRKVDEASGGQVGYIHIPDMSVPGLNAFTKLFYTQLNKKALIIDDRMNGGGNVSPMILERLSRQVYRMSMYRNNAHKSTVPDAAHYGPKVCLIDKYSSSDGDLFPYGFRKLGLGKLVGTRSWGGIVGISSSQPFIDGQDLRTPFFTSYGVDTGDWIIEGHGVDPDIVVDNNPYDEFNGIDAQLNKAVELMLEALKDFKPLPEIPSKAPDKSK